MLKRGEILFIVLVVIFLKKSFFLRTLKTKTKLKIENITDFAYSKLQIRLFEQNYLLL